MVNLFGSEQGFTCHGGSTSGGGGGSTSGGGSTGVSGTVSAIIIVDPSGGGGEPWSGRVQIEGTGGELSSTGGSLVVHISNPEDITSSNNSSSSTSVSGLNAAGGGGSLQVHVSSLGGINGLVVYNGNEQGGGGTTTTTTIDKVGVSSIDPGINIGVSGYDSQDIKVTLDGESVNVNNVSLSGAVSGTSPGGTVASSVNVSSIGNVVGLIVYNANEQGGGGNTTVNINKVGVSSVDPGVNIGVSGYDSADVKVSLDGETVTVTGELLVTQDISDSFNVNDGGGSLTVDGTVGVSGYDSADVKVTLDGEIINAKVNKVGVSSIDPGINVGVSGYNSADVKVTLDGEYIAFDPTATVAVNVNKVGGVSLPTSALPVYSTSGLRYAYVSLSAAGDIPVSNGTLIAAPGTGYAITVYTISIILYAAGTVNSTAFLTDGNDTGTNRIAFAVGYGTNPTNVVLSNFHGLKLTSATALKYSATESATNAYSHIVVWYRVLPG